MSGMITIEPKFFVVLAVRFGIEDPDVVGIFSQSTDAQAFYDELVAAKAYPYVIEPLKRTMRTIMNDLARQRLGELAKQFTCIQHR
ncbi:MAG: hypothetical protein KDJ39_05965 [Gammaproteobacteria bacterium]|nr:hypothetical protein [Gammaproteobacteria bacterium]